MTNPIKLRDCPMCHETPRDEGVILTAESLVDLNIGLEVCNLSHTIRCCNCGVSITDEYLSEVVQLWNGEAKVEDGE